MKGRITKVEEWFDAFQPQRGSLHINLLSVGLDCRRQAVFCGVIYLFI